MIAKKLPGAGWTYYVYDKGDRLVLTQDGNQRERGEWSFRVEDALGRECLTGVLAGTYNAFGSPLGNVQVVAARDRNAETYGELHGYLVGGLTIPAGAEVQTVNWWDDYSFLGREADMPGSSYGYSAPPSGSSYGERYGDMAQGLLTGRWSKSLGEVREGVGAAVCETWAYDDHGRAVFHVKGYPSGKRLVERSGYDFVGNLTSLGKTLYDEGTTSHTEAYTYTYDNWGRQQNTTHSLDGGTAITLSSNSYDAVGRLSGTTRGSSPNLTSSYTYNVRSWLTGIGGTLFSETLTYETPRTGSSLPGQWSGNISGFQTSTVGSQTMRYDFGYDLLGRLTDANYGGSNSSTTLAHSRTYGYDLNGNMTKRRSKEGADLYQGAWLEWTWNMGNGNRPSTWHQQRTLSAQYNPQYPSGTAQVANAGYAYDGMGNRTAELDGQGDTLSVVRYNLLNLPEEYVSSSGETVRYVYSADGEKLYVQQTAPSNVTQGTEYAANYRIDNGTISMIHTDAGYYTPMLPGGSGHEHVWSLKDHLGNTRVLASGRGASLASYHYDPFGESIDVILNPPSIFFPYDAKESPYRYGGKEWNATSSTYDFEARYLSPSFHRFTTMDPLCEKYYSISPYAYCANDPVNVIDPSGCADWKLVWKGVRDMAMGAGTAIAGTVVVGASGGTGSLLGGAMFLEGGGQAVFGFTSVIVGLISDPSEETETIVQEVITSPSDAVAFIGDEVSGTQNNEIRKGVKTAVSIVSAVVALPENMNSAVKTVLKLESALSLGAEVSKIVKADTSVRQPSSTETKTMTEEDQKKYQYSEGQKNYLWHGEQ